MILIDTGYLIAILDVRDELHARAVRWSRFINESVLVTTPVLIEAVNHFSGSPLRSSMRVLIRRLEEAQECEIVHLGPDLLAAGLTLHQTRDDKQWSLTDCISFALMEQRGINRALAFDRHFEQAGFVPLLRMEPTGS